jgi:hypothetical protein
MILDGETAEKLCELRARGIIRSYADGVNQAIQILYDKITECDLRSERFRALHMSQDERG